MSGFSSLASQLADELGPRRAAEVLLERMNRLHTVLIRPVHAFAGSVIAFAGDSITCWFDDSPIHEAEEEGSGSRRAVACALAMQDALSRESQPSLRGAVALKVALAAGEARRMLVGDPKLLRIDAIAGATLARMAQAEKHAAPGMIVASLEVAGPARAVVEDHHTDGWLQLVRIRDQIDRPVEAPWPAVESSPEGWVLPAVAERLAVEPSFADLRAVVPMFASFGGIDYDADADAAQKLDGLVRHVQRVLDRSGGALLQLTIGDKGSYFYGVVGAPVARPDAARRAASAALELRELPAELGHAKLAIGMTFGRAWSGVSGTDERSCYTVMGDEVNLAARLMQNATPGEIVVSSSFAAAAPSFAYEAKGNLTIKGRAQPVAALSLTPRPEAAPRRETRHSLVGRKAELDAIYKAHARSAEHAQAVYVEAQAGMGKSRLADEAMARAHARSARTAFGAGDSALRASPLRAWRDVFRQLLELESGEADRTANALFAKVDAIAPELSPRLPLRGPVLGSRLEETELTKWLSDELRADNTRELMVGLVAAVASTTAAPTLIVLDDAQWIDSASWALARRIVQDVRGVTLLLLARPHADDEGQRSDDHDKIVTDPATTKLALGPLDEGGTLELVRGRLGAERIPERLARFLSSRAAGRPLLAELLVASLLESGGLKVESGVCTLAEGFDEATVELPETVEGMIAERLDRLAPGDLAVLGRASVLGARFDRRSLAALSAEDPTPAVSRLEERELLVPENGELRFAHALVRDVTYGRLLFATRRELHREAAENIRSEHGADLEGWHVPLAYHYLGAEDRPRAAEHFGRAGEVALKTGAFRETTVFLDKALELSGPDLSDATRAQHKRRLASAWYRLGDLPRSTSSAEEAVAVFDRNVPKAGAKLAVGVLTELLQQVVHRVFPHRAISPAPENRRGELRTAVSLYQNLSEVYYLGGMQGPSIYTALRQVNVAERAGVSDELAEAYAVLSIIAGVVGRRDLSKRYEGLAAGVVEKLDNPRALAMLKHQRSLTNAAYAAFDDVIRDERAAIATFERLGDIGRKRDGLGLLGTTEYLASRYQDAKTTLTALLSTRTGDDKFVQEIWGAAWLGALALVERDLPAAVSHLERSLSLLDRNTVGLMEISCRGMLGLAHIHLGDRDLGAQQIERAYEIIEKAKGRPTGHISLDGFAAVADSYLLWASEAKNGDAARAKAEKRALVACDWLDGFAKAFPVGVPAARLMRGRAHLHLGKRHAASRSFEDGLAVARTFGMTCEEGRILLAMASAASGDERRRLARKASETLATVGAVLYRSQADELASPSPSTRGPN
ncbi:MAG: AAA family ATPase [Polyangiaceae bacterium]|nr:AAA family ATPase [Polyangiaceae bacterium]